MSAETILYLGLASFFAGLIDAVVGGGGLIQLPVALLVLPGFPVNQIVGTLKIPSFCGTALAAAQYHKTARQDWKSFPYFLVTAMIAAITGSYLLSRLQNDFMKPVLLVVLSSVAVFTFLKKDFGTVEVHKPISNNKRLLYFFLVCIVLGFYDGFIGHGTGTFLILLFITLLGTNFIQASASAKFINLATNLGSVILFTFNSSIHWEIALPLCISNLLGSFVGVKLALKKGNPFIRLLFISVVLTTLVKFGWDIFR